MDRFARSTSSYRSICAQCRQRLLPNRPSVRPLSTSSPRAADPPPDSPLLDFSNSKPSAAEPSTEPSAQEPTDQTTSSSPPSEPTAPPSLLSQLRSRQSPQRPENSPKPSSYGTSLASIYEKAKTTTPEATSLRSQLDLAAAAASGGPEPHHLHVYSTRHNTHITLTNPNRDAIISVSAGTIGFRKATRGTYDAGYQLGAYVMGRIQQQGLLAKIQGLEVVLRDFGPGREAVSKVLLGSEGRNLRGRVVRVCDATRLKFGGTRSKNQRRL
ncbi:MAG: hypothetical protein Q9219_004407 [cf. Caloplaca sp. 3 TL-2023]